MSNWFQRSVVRDGRTWRAQAVVAFALVLVAAVMLSACGGSNDSTETNTGQSEEVSAADGSSSSSPAKIAAIFKDSSSSYWIEQAEGAEAGGASLGSKAEVSVSAGQSEANVQSQITKVENAITAGAEAIAIAPSEPEALMPVLSKAVGEGIPVVVVDTEMPEFEEQSAFVGTDNVEAGEKAAAALGEALPSGGEIGVIGGAPGITSVEARVEGFQKGIKGTKLNVVSELPTKECDAESGVNDAENMLTSHPNLVGIFAGCLGAAEGAAQPVKKVGADRVKLVAVDVSESAVPLIESGVIYATVAQFPKKMGQLGVETAYKALQGESIPSYVNSGIEVVTKENAAQFK